MGSRTRSLYFHILTNNMETGTTGRDCFHQTEENLRVVGKELLYKLILSIVVIVTNVDNTCTVPLKKCVN